MFSVVNFPVQHGTVCRVYFKFIFHTVVNNLALVGYKTIVPVFFNADMGIVCAGDFSESNLLCLFERDLRAGRLACGSRRLVCGNCAFFCFFTGVFRFGIKA